MSSDGTIRPDDATRPKLSIVMPVYNGAETLAAQLDSLVAAEKPPVPFEVVISNNRSTDDTVAVANSFADRLPISIVDANRAAGINVARNCGVRGSLGDWILLCDCDDIVDPKWLVNMVRAFEDGHDAVGGVIDYRMLNDAALRRSRGTDAATVQQVMGFRTTAHGANCGFTRRAFEAIGGFDEDFRFGGEDIEFFWRVQGAGFPLVEVADAVVNYRLRPTMDHLWKQWRAYGKSEPHLYTKFRSQGVKRRSIKQIAQTFFWLVTRAPLALDPNRRVGWVRVLAQEVGRISGSIEFRVLYL